MTTREFIRRNRYEVTWWLMLLAILALAIYGVAR